MLSVEDALTQVLAGVRTLDASPVAIVRAALRHTRATVNASATNPPCDVSAMDGYALRAQDVRTVPATLKVIGEAPAGGNFAGSVGPGEAVRIFTGGPVPDGADAVIAQEDVRVTNSREIEIRESAGTGKHIRRKGGDFSRGDQLLAAGQHLSAPALALAAAGGAATLEVAPRPRVALLATGDELVPPGTMPAANQIVASNTLGLAALVIAAGGEPVDLGIAPDDPKAIAEAASSAGDADILVTTGGASVGDRDYVQSALGAAGLEVGFWKIAMKPGKPLIFGTFRGKPFFGLPGNPVSALVCALLFLRPALLKMQGRDPALARIDVTLAGGLPANGARQDYLRAKLVSGEANGLSARVFPVQDSASLKVLAASDVLVIRPPHAPPAQAGDLVPAIPLAGVW